jgi:hypothetical protein
MTPWFVSMAMALRLAPNSTGRVATWKSTIAANSATPSRARFVALMKIPIRKIGNQAWVAKPVAGTSAPRNRKPASWRASWNAWPVSWAATATAATELEPPTGGESRIVRVRGS